MVEEHDDEEERANTRALQTFVPPSPLLHRRGMFVCLCVNDIVIAVISRALCLPARRRAVIFLQ